MHAARFSAVWLATGQPVARPSVNRHWHDGRGAVGKPDARARERDLHDVFAKSQAVCRMRWYAAVMLSDAV